VLTPSLAAPLHCAKCGEVKEKKSCAGLKESFLPLWTCFEHSAFPSFPKFMAFKDRGHAYGKKIPYLAFLLPRAGALSAVPPSLNSALHKGKRPHNTQSCCCSFVIFLRVSV